MHLCFLCNEYPPAPHGGIGAFTQVLARALVRAGHRATILGVYPPERAGIEEDAGARVIRLAPSAVPGTRFLLNGRRLEGALAQIHIQAPIDVIEGPENALAALNGAIPARQVIRMHGGHHFFAVTQGKKPAAWRGWIERRSFARADRLCAVSRYVADITRELLGLNGRPIEILPNPVDTGAFAPRPWVAAEPGLIVYTGSLCEKKGVRQLLEAMPRIVAAVPRARLILAGRDTIDRRTGRSYRESLRGLVPPTCVPRITFAGHIEHDCLPDVLAPAAVCVYPSHMEALPLAWLEGLAMGKAVVASRTGPGPEVVEDGVSGLLTNPYDPASIAAALIRVLTDEPLRRSLGAAARKRAVERFSIGRLVRGNIEFYERCLRDKP